MQKRKNNENSEKKRYVEITKFLCISFSCKQHKYMYIKIIYVVAETCDFFALVLIVLPVAIGGRELRRSHLTVVHK